MGRGRLPVGLVNSAERHRRFRFGFPWSWSGIARQRQSHDDGDADPRATGNGHAGTGIEPDARGKPSQPERHTGPQVLRHPARQKDVDTIPIRPFAPPTLNGSVGNWEGSRWCRVGYGLTRHVCSSGSPTNPPPGFPRVNEAAVGPPFLLRRLRSPLMWPRQEALTTLSLTSLSARTAGGIVFARSKEVDTEGEPTETRERARGEDDSAVDATVFGETMDSLMMLFKSTAVAPMLCYG